MRLSSIALAAGLCLSLGACQDHDSNGVFGARVRAYLLEHPEVLQEAMTRLQERQAAQDQQAAAAALPRVRAALEHDPRDFVANPNGRITVTEFFDYRCGHCINIAPHIMQLIHDNPDVRFVFKEMPIFGDVSDEAAYAAIAVRRAGGDNLGLYQTYMTTRNLDAAAVTRIATAHGASASLLADPAFRRQAAAQLTDSHAIADALHIGGTPGFVVGDQVIVGEDLPRLTQAIQQQRRRA
jgi:protein-disulfide isomerase